MAKTIEEIIEVNSHFEKIFAIQWPVVKAVK